MSDDALAEERIIFEYDHSLHDGTAKWGPSEGRGRWKKILQPAELYVKVLGMYSDLTEREKEFIDSLRYGEYVEDDERLSQTEVDIINAQRDPLNRNNSPNGVIRYANGDFYEGDFKKVEKDGKLCMYVLEGFGRYKSKPVTT